MVRCDECISGIGLCGQGAENVKQTLAFRAQASRSTTDKIQKSREADSCLGIAASACSFVLFTFYLSLSQVASSTFLCQLFYYLRMEFPPTEIPQSFLVHFRPIVAYVIPPIEFYPVCPSLRRGSLSPVHIPIWTARRAICKTPLELPAVTSI